MNKILDQCFLFPGRLISLIFPYKLCIILRPILRRFYTGWIKNNFLYIGNNTLICKGLHLVGGDKIKLGSYTCIDKNCSITALGNKNEIKIKIGDNVSIGPYAHITAINYIEIGNNVGICPRCLITDNSKKPTVQTMRIKPRLRPITSKGPVIIGDYTWIGENVSIMPGVNIGKSSVIGANSVVTKSFPERSIIAGNPAKIIGTIQ